MIFRWYEIADSQDFTIQGEDIYSKEYTLNLEGIGVKKILVVFGLKVSIIYEDQMLTHDVNGKNPGIYGDYAIFFGRGKFYLGIKVDED